MDPQSSSPSLSTQPTPTDASVVHLPKTVNPARREEPDEANKLETKIRLLDSIHKSIKENFHKSGENLRAVQEERRIIQSAAEKQRKFGQELDAREAQVCLREEYIRNDLERLTKWHAEEKKNFRRAEKQCIAQNNLTHSMIAEKQALMLANSVQKDDIADLQAELKALKVVYADKRTVPPKYDTLPLAARIKFDAVLVAIIEQSLFRHFQTKRLRSPAEQERDRLRAIQCKRRRVNTL
jgi:hypothetical protein